MLVRRNALLRGGTAIHHFIQARKPEHQITRGQFGHAQDGLVCGCGRRKHALIGGVRDLQQTPPTFSVIRLQFRGHS